MKLQNLYESKSGCVCVCACTPLLLNIREVFRIPCAHCGINDNQGISLT